MNGEKGGLLICLLGCPGNGIEFSCQGVFDGIGFAVLSIDGADE
jgi:hypothetical protein